MILIYDIEANNWVVTGDLKVLALKFRKASFMLDITDGIVGTGQVIKAKFFKYQKQYKRINKVRISE